MGAPDRPEKKRAFRKREPSEKESLQKKRAFRKREPSEKESLQKKRVFAKTRDENRTRACPRVGEYQALRGRAANAGGGRRPAQPGLAIVF
jgi:hypothetical protein